MSYEIEIKAHACRALKERIDAYVGTVGEDVVKSDTYYAFAHDEVPRFRLRLENGGILVSAKRSGKEVYYALAASDKARLLHRTIDAMFEIACPSGDD